MNTKFTSGQASQLPVFDGDGYSFGGGWIVTFGRSSISLGNGPFTELANLLAAAPDLYEALSSLLLHVKDPESTTPAQRCALIDAGNAALSKARGEQ